MGTGRKEEGREGEGEGKVEERGVKRRGGQEYRVRVSKEKRDGLHRHTEPLPACYM